MSSAARFRRGVRPGAFAAAVAIAAMALPAFTASPAHAACTNPPDPIASIALADVVFVGRVSEVADLGRVATMDVLEIWKGPDIGTPVTVNGSFSGEPIVGANDRTYQPGQTYLVVPFGTRAPFFDEVCSATRVFAPSGGLIPGPYQQAVGATTARVPTPVATTTPGDSGSSSGPLIVGGSALVLALAALVIMRSRRRKKPTRIRLGAEPPVPRPAEPKVTLPKPKPSRAARKKAKTDKKAAKKEAKARRLEPSPVEARRRRSDADEVESRAEKRATRRKGAPKAADPPGVREGRAKEKKAKKAKKAKKVPAKRVVTPQARSPKFGRSGLSELESMRKKTRKVKGRKN